MRLFLWCDSFPVAPVPPGLSMLGPIDHVEHAMSGSIRDTLEQKLARFEQLERDMADPAIQGDGARMSATAREHGGLAKVAGKYRDFTRLTDEIAECKEMAQAAEDPEEREMAETEMESLCASNARPCGRSCCH